MDKRMYVSLAFDRSRDEKRTHRESSSCCSIQRWYYPSPSGRDNTCSIDCRTLYESLWDPWCSRRSIDDSPMLPKLGQSHPFTRGIHREVCWRLSLTLTLVIRWTLAAFYSDIMIRALRSSYIEPWRRTVTITLAQTTDVTQSRQWSHGRCESGPNERGHSCRDWISTRDSPHRDSNLQRMLDAWQSRFSDFHFIFLLPLPRYPSRLLSLSGHSSSVREDTRASARAKFLSCTSLARVAI
jgi:hypothetical protein